MERPKDEGDEETTPLKTKEEPSYFINGVVLDAQIEKADVDTKTTEKNPPSLLQRFRDNRPYFVEIPAFFFFLAYKGSVPLKSQFVEDLVTVRHAQDSSTDEDLIQKESAQILSILALVRNVPCLLTTLLISAYSDVFGRKWGLATSGLGGALKALAFLLLSVLGPQHIWLLYVGEAFEGLGGSLMAFKSCSCIYITEITNLTDRTTRLAIYYSITFLATAVGNLVIGYFIKDLGFTASFGYILALYAFSILWIWLFLPETAELNKTFSCTQVLTVLKSTFLVFRVYVHRRAHHGRAILLLMVIVIMCDFIVKQGRNDVEVLYMMAEPFSWDSVTIGYFQFIKYLGQGFFGLTTKCLMRCMRDTTLGMLGGLAGAASNLLMGLASTDPQLWLVPVIAAPISMVVPMCQAIMSKRVTPHEQGALFASMGLMEGVCDLFAPSLFDIIYALTLTTFSGAVFIIIGILYFTAAVCFGLTKLLEKIPD